MNKRSFVLFGVLLVCLVLGGCAAGVTRVKVEHDPLSKIEAKKQGTVLLREFKDIRSQDRQYIGNKRNGFGMVLGHIATEENVKLTEVLTGYFADSLSEAGYKVIQGQNANATQAQGKPVIIVEGEIFDFWLDLYMAVWHYMGVKLTAKNPDGKVFWERTIKAEQKNVLWVGATSEYERVIRQSLTQALDKASLEFAAEPFYRTLESERL